MILDLTIPEYAYMFGFFQTDGNLSQGTRNRGRFSIELSKRDEHILYEFQKLIPVYSSIRYRTRDTNFKENYQSCVLTVCDLDFRTCLCNAGIPYGNKSKLIHAPSEPYSKIDYFRGLIDGNGSLGITKKGLPFISLTTHSVFTATEYKKFIFECTNMNNNAQRNKRDNIYNIVMYREDAQIISQILYPAGCLCLKRKYDEFQMLLLWKRPSEWKIKTIMKEWTPDQDEYIKTHPMSESKCFLGRSEKSIKTRLWRLSKGRG